MTIYTDEDEETQVLFKLGRYKDLSLSEGKFVESIYEYYEKYDHITDKQFKILKEIYIKNKIDDHMDSTS